MKKKTSHDVVTEQEYMNNLIWKCQIEPYYSMVMQVFQACTLFLESGKLNC